MNTKLIWGAIIVVVIGLFIWGNSTPRTAANTFPNTDIPCLANGHQSLSEHIHPQLIITVDGENEVIPANVGITNECMAEVHTHDASGELHVESVYMGNIGELRLRDFFRVWDREIEREGYGVEIRVGGDVVESADDVRFRDKEQLEIIYTSVDEGSEVATTTETQ